MSGLLSFFMGDVRPSARDVVVSVKHTVYAISWMAINQSVCFQNPTIISRIVCYIALQLSPEEASGRQRPQRFWSGTDISQLTLLSGFNDHNVRIGDKLLLKSPPGEYATRHGKSEKSEDTITVETFTVEETQTSIEILWQDGSRETSPSVLLIPYLNPDEYDCWCVCAISLNFNLILTLK